MQNTPLQEKIAKRAFEIYLARGKEHGADMDDWLKAEQEMVEKGTTINLKKPVLKKQPGKRQKRLAY